MFAALIQFSTRVNSSTWQQINRFGTTEARWKHLEERTPIWLKNKLYDDHFSNDEIIKYYANPTKVEFTSAPTNDMYNGKQQTNIIYSTKLNNNSDILNEVVIVDDNSNIESNKIIQKKNRLARERFSNEKPDDYNFYDVQPKGRQFISQFGRSIKSTDRLLENFIHDLEGTEAEFILYEMDKPDIWFGTQVQVLEKLSTPEGKTKWRDITQENAPRVSSRRPEWSNRDVNIRYHCAQPTSAEHYTLPAAAVRLLLPRDGGITKNAPSIKFLIVPFEDIKEKINENLAKPATVSTTNVSSSTGAHNERSVLIRMSRALFGTNGDNYMIVNEGSDKYLQLPYTQPHCAQIDIEVKADENQLVYVGSSGRLTTAVSESMRHARSAVIVQVANTGLAAARLRPKVRECGPEVPWDVKYDGLRTEADPVLIPPMHTRRFRLDLPADIPDGGTRCSVVLLNEADESIAVREVRVKRGDRCFCVWHCECTCLSEDPRLLCQDMSEYQQLAAGLSPRDRARHVRAACYPDVVTINLLVTMMGVIFLLLSLGLLKACLGLFLRCVGSWGIEQLLQTPRPLDSYYESGLKSRPVVFDEGGWPVHPDTKKRTVRLISKPMEFILNIIFFVTMPCLVLWNTLRLITAHCQKKHSDTAPEAKITPRKMPSSHDMQVRDARWRWRRRKKGLSKWMTPRAEELSTDIWRNGLTEQGFSQPDCMRPLLREERYRGKLYELQPSLVDSEHDDTEYVLLQMQRSKESLAKNQGKLLSNSSDTKN